MAVSGIGAAGGAGWSDLSRLAELYRQQITAGGPTDPSATAAASGATATVSDPAASAAAGRGADFAGVLGSGLSQLESLDATAAVKATQAATGDLTNVHDYVIAATQAQTATELTTTVRNKALDAFGEIMRMSL